MRSFSDNRFDKFRIPHPMGEVPTDIRDYAGAFVVPFSSRNPVSRQVPQVGLRVIASKGGVVWGRNEAGANWDHVSVSLPYRTPTWEEMNFIKDLFFFPDEVAMQLHPVKEYINNYPFCLHLWRPLHQHIPLPPSILVGVKELNP
jgi:hypothetical protein